MIYLHAKHHQLMNFLLNQNGAYVSATTLAESLNVTDRTIRNYIKEINQNCSDITIISSTLGYAIKQEQIVPHNDFVNDQEMEDALLDCRIIKYLMNKKEYTSYDEIADTFFYSPQTIRSRIQKLTMNIHALGLDVQIDTKVFKGIKMNGSEIQKRVLLESFFTSISVKKEVYKDFVVSGFNSWVDATIVEAVFRIVDMVNKEYELNLEFSMYKKMTIQLIIIIHQINHQHLVEIESEECGSLVSFKEFEVVETLQKHLCDYVNIINGEVVFLVNYLISLQLDLEEAQIEHKDTTIMSKIEVILWQVEKVYGVPTFSESRFRSNISNHIYRIIYPVSHNLLIYNPFVKEAKSQYFFSFSIASHIALLIEKEFLVEIQDSEIAYLAYHIQVILDSQSKKKIKTIILYHRGYERTKLLASKITTYFDELDVCNVEKYSLDYVFSHNYLYVGTNLVAAPKGIENLILIQSAFQSSDIKKIRFYLESQNSIIEQSAIYWLQENSPEQMIYQLLRLNDQETFYPSIMKRERISYTSIGNSVAIPHPYFEKEVFKESIIIGVNKQPIVWGNEFVQLVIIYIPSSDIERNEYAFAEFFQKTKSIENVRKLVHAHSKEEFINIWNHI
ncbi:BglG family transcription antiterminator [Virgibacillus dokdonensis]|uniref:BglG family transcription antiterminator n=1 Tax=Virgibacillus dokdonensis TaxID=302167 RepID=UPI001F3BCB46|nr:PTS sugar transporter subunit IIA [Virgibacillus dokdonensis]